MSRDERAFDEFVRVEHPRLVRAAFLLAGTGPAAEDLAQETLVRAWVHWGKVRGADSPRAYTRRILVNAYLRSRTGAAGRESAVAAVPDHPRDDAGYARVEARQDLAAALAALPARQRAAVVLRHYEQLTEAETATALRCPVGTVKSLTSRGLAGLRDRLATAPTSQDSP